MAPGFDGELRLLAFDHRGVFLRGLFDFEAEPSSEQLAAAIDAKRVIYEGVLEVAERGKGEDGLGLLVDEWLGGEIASAARSRGLIVAMPVEESDRAVFEFAHGEDFGAHLESFRPSFAKVLVRYNVEGSVAENGLQAARLRRLSEWLAPTEIGFLFELIVEPTAEQLDTVDGDRRRFELERRPALIRDGIAALQAEGIEADVWKLEGIESTAEAAAVVEQARAGGRDRVICTVLGAGAPVERVETWLRVAGEVEGYAGFAVGRSIWLEPLREYLAGTSSRGDAVAAIADRYLRLAEAYGH